MRKTKRFLAFSLAAALVVTSLPGVSGGAVRNAAASETGQETTTRWIDWNITDEENGKVSGADCSLTKTYSGVKIDGSMSVQESMIKPNNDVILDYISNSSGSSNSTQSPTATSQPGSSQGSGGDLSVDDCSYGYQWYVKDGDGLKKLQNETDNYLYSYMIPDEYKYNDVLERTFVCKVTLKSVTLSDYSTKNLSSYSDINNDNITLNYNVTYKYTGPSESGVKDGTVKISDYFDGVSDIHDEDITYSNSNNIKSMYMGISLKDYDYSFDYEWKAVAEDGTEKVVNTKKDATYMSSYTPKVSEDFSDNGSGAMKAVSKYVCTVSLKYGKALLQTVSKTFSLKYSPVSVISPSASETVKTSRLNGKQTLAVRAYNQDTSVCDGIAYQWYSVDKDGKETKLDKETADTMKVKVSDYNISYKCVVIPKMNATYTGPNAAEQVRVFKFTQVSGYKVTDISKRYIYINMGEKKTLSVKAETDAGYVLKYKWQRADGLDENGKIKLTDAGDANAIDITLSKSSDIESYYDSDLRCSYSYILTVTVEKDGAAVETYKYPFSVHEDGTLEYKSNEGRVVAEPGADVSLYVKETPKTGYTCTKTWYKEVASAKMVYKTDTETGKGSYVPADSNFKAPEGNDIVTKEEYDYDESDENIMYRYYYREVKTGTDGMAVSEDKTTLTAAGKTGENINDCRGKYICRAVLQRQEVNQGVPETVTLSNIDINFNVVYDTGLTVYAKNSTVQAAKGSAAKLEVVAKNINEQSFPIIYKWEKWNAVSKAYEEVKDASGQTEKAAVLTVALAADASYGRYRVTVQDTFGGKVITERVVTLTLTETNQSEVAYIAYTPSYSKFTKAVGETIEMNVDVAVKKGTEAVTDIFYEWYRSEKQYKYDEDGDLSSETVDWELLNQDTAKYSTTVASDDDGRVYKCLVTFKTTDANGDMSSRTLEFKFGLKIAAKFDLEMLTPGTQYKKLGSSADYSVRVVSNDAKVVENVKYQWYRLDEMSWDEVIIENATAATYHIDALKAENFGTLYCRAVYTDADGEKVCVVAGFDTQIYTEASLKKSSETKETKLGSNVELKPQISNPSGETLTYQWYRLDEDDDWQVIYGATAETYQVNEIGTGDLTSYRCKISTGGISALSYTVRLVKESDDYGKVTVDYADGYKRTVKTVLGESAEFAVKAESDKGLELKYQWYKGYVYDEDDDYYDYGGAIGGATSASYKIEKVTLSDYEIYYCKVMDTEGNTDTISFELCQGTGLEIKDDIYDGGVAGYETTLGGNVTLTATAEIASGYTPYYQWYKFDDEGKIKKLYDETGTTLTLNNVTAEMLGYYVCEVSDSRGNIEHKHFYVYIDTGLTIVSGCRNVVAENNNAKMFVKASAKEAVTYKWQKYVTVKKGDASYDPDLDEDDKGEYDIWQDIEGAASDTYSISGIKEENYGDYRCVVATTGEKVYVNFELEPGYEMTGNRLFAQQGDELVFKVDMKNIATNINYTYTWYAEDLATGYDYKVADATAAEYKVKAPKCVTPDAGTGYQTAGYTCVIENKDLPDTDKKKVIATVYASVRILPDVAFETKKLPETNHPFDTEYDLKAFKISGAKELNVTFDAKTALDDMSVLYVIGSDGDYVSYDSHDFKGAAKTVSVKGESAVFLVVGNGNTGSYGYRVTSIKKPGTTTKKTGTTKKKVPAKGKKYTTGNVTYKVTKSAAKNGTVTVSGVKTKKLKSAVVKDTVKINGYTFKVTAINANAFKGCSKLTKVTIGKNVKTIGANAFANDKKLKTIKIKATGLKKVGKKAFTKVPKKAKATVPKKKKKAYTKLLKKGNYKGKIK